MAKNADFIKDTMGMIPIDFTAAADINTGEIALVEDCYGLAYADVTSGNTGSLIVECTNCEVPKATGTGKTFAIGDIMWLDPSGLLVYKDFATGYIFVGYAIEAATAAAKR